MSSNNDLRYVGNAGIMPGLVRLYHDCFGTIAAVDSRLEFEFTDRDVQLLKRQTGVGTSTQIRVLEHDICSIRFELPGADFTRGSDNYQASVDRLKAVGNVLSQAVLKRRR